MSELSLPTLTQKVRVDVTDVERAHTRVRASARGLGGELTRTQETGTRAFRGLGRSAEDAGKRTSSAFRGLGRHVEETARQTGGFKARFAEAFAQIKTGVSGNVTSLQGLRSAASSAFGGGLTLGALGSAAAIGLVVTAVAAVAGGILNLLKTTIDYADGVRRVQQVTGATAEQASVLVAVFDDYKVSAEGAATAAKFFARNISGTKLDKYFSQTEIATMRTDGLSGSLEALGRRYDQFGSQTERVAFLTDVFGRSGDQLIEMFDEGAEKIAKQTEEVRKYNQIVSQETIDNTRKLQLQVDSLGDAWGGLKTRGGAALAALAVPVLAKATEGVDNFLAMFTGQKPKGLEEAPAKIKKVTAAQEALAEAQKASGESAQSVIDGIDGQIASFDRFRDAADKGLADFISATVDNGRLVAEFYSNVNRIFEAGAPTLARHLLDMGTKGAKAADQAVQRIGSNEGLGGLELQVQQALAASNVKLNDGLRAFVGSTEDAVQLTAQAAAALAPAMQSSLEDVARVFDTDTSPLEGVAKQIFEQKILPAIRDGGGRIVTAVQSTTGEIYSAYVDLGGQLRFTISDINGNLTTLGRVKFDPAKLSAKQLGDAFNLPKTQARDLLTLLQTIDRQRIQAHVDILTRILGPGIPNIDPKTGIAKFSIGTGLSSQKGHTGGYINQAGRIERFHSGGIVGGGRLKHDEVPLIAQRGEAIVDAETTSRFGPAFFAALKKMRRFHEGGIVGSSAGVAAGGTVSVQIPISVGPGAHTSAEAVVTAIEGELAAGRPQLIAAISRGIQESRRARAGGVS